ncbi:MAG: endonuclease/exonuclease/phosphatase family protein [Acidobacteria bacterium]|nr:endonuclease/exonuclease/phosphatase family protein [Acidobacteriota bacterium]
MHHGTISTDIAKGLKVLWDRIEKTGIPPSKLDESLNLATWNIREFGRKPRREASLHFIAEILGQFDLIAVTELRENLAELKQVLTYLGPYWKVVFSDYNTDSAGNRERIAYVYDKRAVDFKGLAAEADPPKKKIDGEWRSQFEWWRSPYMASFQAGNFDFILLTVHIRWDATGGEASRKEALKNLATWVDKRVKEKYVTDRDIILVGDFNMPKVGDDLFKAITSNGLRIPEPLLSVRSNLARNRSYDQILYYQNHSEQAFQGAAGVLDFFHDDHQKLFPGDPMTKTEFTYELSDHLPLWAQIDVDNDEEVIDQILNQ